jgi:drug/metabolite transporter (DMT)-like permease
MAGKSMKAGALWMIFAISMFTLMGCLIKVLGQDLHAFQIGFFRCVFGLVFLAPFTFKYGIDVWKTKRPGMHALRVTFGTLGMCGLFYSIVNLPYADATAIAFARPLFFTLLAIIFLKENVRWRRWTAMVVGFVGVVVVMQPNPSQWNIATLAALWGAVMVAGVVLCVRMLSETEKPLTIMLWFTVASVPVSIIPAIPVWQTPELWHLGLGLLTGLLGSLGQYGIIRAFRAAPEASAVAPVEYGHIILAASAGIAFFDEPLRLNTIIGALLIMGSGIYVVYRESKMKK